MVTPPRRPAVLRRAARDGPRGDALGAVGARASRRTRGRVRVELRDRPRGVRSRVRHDRSAGPESIQQHDREPRAGVGRHAVAAPGRTARGAATAHVGHRGIRRPRARAASDVGSSPRSTGSTRRCSATASSAVRPSVSSKGLLGLKLERARLRAGPRVLARAWSNAVGLEALNRLWERDDDAAHAQRARRPRPLAGPHRPPRRRPDVASRTRRRSCRASTDAVDSGTPTGGRPIGRRPRLGVECSDENRSDRSRGHGRGDRPGRGHGRVRHHLLRHRRRRAGPRRRARHHRALRVRAGRRAGQAHPRRRRRRVRPAVVHFVVRRGRPPSTSSSRPCPRSSSSSNRCSATSTPRHPTGTILASNTSGFPIAQIAEVTKRPSLVVGWHWASPPAVMRLAEIVRRPTPATPRSRRSSTSPPCAARTRW